MPNFETLLNSFGNKQDPKILLRGFGVSAPNSTDKEDLKRQVATVRKAYLDLKSDFSDAFNTLEHWANAFGKTATKEQFDKVVDLQSDLNEVLTTITKIEKEQRVDGKAMDRFNHLLSSTSIGLNDLSNRGPETLTDKLKEKRLDRKFTTKMYDDLATNLGEEIGENFEDFSKKRAEEISTNRAYGSGLKLALASFLGPAAPIVNVMDQIFDLDQKSGKLAGKLYQLTFGHFKVTKAGIEQGHEDAITQAESLEEQARLTAEQDRKTADRNDENQQNFLDILQRTFLGSKDDKEKKGGLFNKLFGGLSSGKSVLGKIFGKLSGVILAGFGALFSGSSSLAKKFGPTLLSGFVSMFRSSGKMLLSGAAGLLRFLAPVIAGIGNAMAAILPVALPALAVAGVAALSAYLGTKLYEWMPDTWKTAIIDTIGPLIDGTLDLFSTGWDKINEMVTDLFEGIANVWGNIKEWSSKKWDDAKNLGKKVVQKVEDVRQSAIAGTSKAIEWVTNTAAASVDTVKGWAGAKKDTQDGILTASKLSGVPAPLLAQMASVESNMGRNTTGAKSSAGGTFQFIDKTWLGMMKDHGSKYGFDVSNMDDKQILALKSNERASAAMGAEYVKQNIAITGRSDPASAYLSHFLGPYAAKQVLNADPATDLRTVLGKNYQSIINANPQFEKQGITTAGKLVSWASNVMSGKIIGGQSQQVAQSTLPATSVNASPTMSASAKPVEPQTMERVASTSGTTTVNVPPPTVVSQAPASSSSGSQMGIDSIPMYIDNMGLMVLNTGGLV